MREAKRRMGKKRGKTHSGRSRGGSTGIRSLGSDVSSHRRDLSSLSLSGSSLLLGLLLLDLLQRPRRSSTSDLPDGRSSDGGSGGSQRLLLDGSGVGARAHESPAGRGRRFGRDFFDGSGRSSSFGSGDLSSLGVLNLSKRRTGGSLLLLVGPGSDLSGDGGSGSSRFLDDGGRDDGSGGSGLLSGSGLGGEGSRDGLDGLGRRRRGS